MAYTYCKRCNILFKRNGKPYCNDCQDKINKEHDIIVEYLKENPGAVVIDIIADTGVTLKSINILVEEGYISYVNAETDMDNFELTKKLQKIIKSGKFHSREFI